MKALPRILSSACATGRAARSAWPPAGNGTIMVTLRAGQGACADALSGRAACASGSTAVAVKNSRRFIGSFSPRGFFAFCGSNLAGMAAIAREHRLTGEVRPHSSEAGIRDTNHRQPAKSYLRLEHPTPLAPGKMPGEKIRQHLDPRRPRAAGRRHQMNGTFRLI